MNTGYCKYCGERAPFVLLWPDAEEVCELHYRWREAYMHLAKQAADAMQLRGELTLRPVSALPQPRHAALDALLPPQQHVSSDPGERDEHSSPGRELPDK